MIITTSYLDHLVVERGLSSHTLAAYLRPAPVAEAHGLPVTPVAGLLP
ncbi:MAG TPA: hypothetical protein VIV12_13675 [Streptosporangiaceae bacterium]